MDVWTDSWTRQAMTDTADCGLNGVNSKNSGGGKLQSWFIGTNSTQIETDKK